MPGHLLFEGDEIPTEPGDTAASALLRHGVLTFSRGPKYHRPRGPFCLSGDCAQCHMRVDGRPNVPTCVTPARDGMTLERQNVFGSADTDWLRTVDFLYPRGLDHHHLMTRVKVLNRAATAFARRLSGIGELPDAVVPPVEAVRRDVDVVVVGGGRSGRAAAQAAQASGARVELVDADGPSGARAVGLYEEGGARWVIATTATSLLQLTTRTVVLATGGHEAMSPFESNDLPGVFGARALLRLAHRHGVRPGRRVVVLGSSAVALPLALLLREAGYEVGALVDLTRRLRSDALTVLPAVRPLRALGRKRVTALVVALPGGEEQAIEADLIALAAPVQPAWSLAGQVGAQVEHRQAGYTLIVDAQGRTNVPWLFACGGVCGHQASGEEAGLAASLG